jgi:DNA-binding NarL/FixJ family response regulator
MDDLITDELERARAFGAARPLGIALRAAAAVAVDDEPILLLEESVAVLRTSPARTERARSLVALGAALRRANHRVAARTALHEGLALAEELGATAIASQARIELTAAGTRLPARDQTGAGRLTASERRVCAMAITGMSNPEIAQALFVTRATVESHLHSAYRKLAITSRTQLGAALGSRHPPATVAEPSGTAVTFADTT